jgi:hypothetical protein
MHNYRASGLSVASELALPGFEPCDAANGSDVTFRLGTVPDALSDAEHHGPTWQIAGNRFLLDIPELARFLISDGTQVTVQPEGDTPPEDLAMFLGGSVFGILLHQRQQIVLHGSAVIVDGRAVLFCGASGAGKSTLAALLGERGYALAADDICAVSLTGDVPTVRPDGRRLKLWRESLDALALETRAVGAVRQRVEKFYVEPRAASMAAAPIGAIYILRDARPPHAEGIDRPNTVDAARALLRNAYRPLLVRRMQQRPLYFDAGTRLAALGVVHTLTRPLDFAANDRTIAALEAHWRMLGLLEPPR